MVASFMNPRLLSIACVGACLGWATGAWAMSDPTQAAGDQASIEFLARHWQAPIPPQGETPAHFSPIEAALDPDACGACHRAQYEDWSRSFHSRSMGPGVSGQTMELIH